MTTILNNYFYCVGSGRRLFLLYQTEDGLIRIESRMKDETVWLIPEQMAELFDKAKATINKHIKNIFVEGELVEEQVMRKFGISEFSTKFTPQLHEPAIRLVYLCQQ